jgi:tetratricopeptide (TPR) repeat protein
VIGSGLRGVPASLFDRRAIRAWCPTCFDGDEPVAAVDGLDTYLALLDLAYHAPVASVDDAASPSLQRRIFDSAYLGAVVPDTDAVHNIIGVTLLRRGQYADAVDAFREALRRREDSVDANRNLGTALAETGRPDEAIGYLRRAVQLDPANGGAQYELGSLLLERSEFAQAAAHFQAALRAMPDSAAAHNNLGVALASSGDVHQAIEHFERAVTLDPAFAEARRNLASAQRAPRHVGS